MKYKKVRGQNKIKAVFRERTEARKINVFKSLKSSDKLYKSISAPLYQKGKILRNINVVIEGGYSRSSIYRLGKQGIKADPYHFLSFPSPVDIAYTPKDIQEHITKALEKYESAIATHGEKYGMKASPRINRIEIKYNYM